MSVTLSLNLSFTMLYQEKALPCWMLGHSSSSLRQGKLAISADDGVPDVQRLHHHPRPAFLLMSWLGSSAPGDAKGFGFNCGAGSSHHFLMPTPLTPSD
jgi:hypothetical protein